MVSNTRNGNQKQAMHFRPAKVLLGHLSIVGMSKEHQIGMSRVYVPSRVTQDVRALPRGTGPQQKKAGTRQDSSDIGKRCRQMITSVITAKASIYTV